MGTPTIQGRFPVLVPEDYDSGDEFEISRRQETVSLIRRRQDEELERSLRIDRERELVEREHRRTQRAERRERRAVRERIREEREEVWRAQRERRAPEPDPAIDDDTVVDITFRLPSTFATSRVRRLFRADSSVQELFDYIESEYRIWDAKLVPVSLPPIQRQSQALLHTLGSHQLLINIEEQAQTEEEDLNPGLSEVDGTGIVEAIDLQLFQQRILQHRENLGPARKLIISRANVVMDLLDTYLRDHDLVHYQLDIQFRHEPAVDLGGPTQEALRLFWEGFCEKFCDGRLQKIPRLDHRFDNQWLEVEKDATCRTRKQAYFLFCRYVDGMEWFAAGLIFIQRPGPYWILATAALLSQSYSLSTNYRNCK